MPEINNIPIQPIKPAGPEKPDSSNISKSDTSFKDIFQSKIESTSNLQKEVDQQVYDLSTGKSDNYVQVINLAAKAKLAMDEILEVRNQIIQAYEELIRMRI